MIVKDIITNLEFLDLPALGQSEQVEGLPQWSGWSQPSTVL